LEKIRKEKRVSYMDAIVFYCEQNDFELEVAAKILSPHIKSQLRIEAETLNLLKEKRERLPI